MKFHNRAGILKNNRMNFWNDCRFGHLGFRFSILQQLQVFTPPPLASSSSFALSYLVSAISNPSPREVKPVVRAGGRRIVIDRVTFTSVIFQDRGVQLQDSCLVAANYMPAEMVTSERSDDGQVDDDLDQIAASLELYHSNLDGANFSPDVDVLQQIERRKQVRIIGSPEFAPVEYREARR